MPLNALIFDVDGTLAETEEAHRAAFNRSFEELGYDWHWSVDAYRGLLQVTGGQQRIRHFVNSIGVTLTSDEIARLHKRKNAVYATLVGEGAVTLRPGVARLIDDARSKGIKLGIATTTSRDNLLALLACLFDADATTWFAAIVCGEDVAAKKPDPEAYAQALARLATPAAEVIAIEDSRNGLLAATGCAIRTLVTPSFYSAGEDFTGATLVRLDLERPTPITVDGLLAVISAPVPARLQKPAISLR